jgi:hypothetical protein
LTSVRDGSEWSAPHPGHFTPRERAPGTINNNNNNNNNNIMMMIIIINLLKSLTTSESAIVIAEFIQRFSAKFGIGSSRPTLLDEFISVGRYMKMKSNGGFSQKLLVLQAVSS